MSDPPCGAFQGTGSFFGSEPARGVVLLPLHGRCWTPRLPSPPPSLPGARRAPTVHDHLQTRAITAAIEASSGHGIRVHVPSFAAAFGLPYAVPVGYNADHALRHTQSSVLSPQS